MLVVLSTRSCPSKTRIIVDTDIGDDIDDTWALSLLLTSREVDFRLVVADSYSSGQRAQILARFLSQAGVATLPIALGPNKSGKDVVLKNWAGPKDLEGYKGFVYDDAANAIITEVSLGASSRCKTILVVLSPCPAVSAALHRAPWIAQHVEVVAMGGSIWHGTNGTGPPYAEWNIFGDVQSAQAMYNAPWNLTTAPLDTAGAAQLSEEAFTALIRCKAWSLLVRVLLDMYSAWLPLCPWPEAKHGPLGRADLTSFSSVLYDALAAMLLPFWKPEAFVELQEVNVRVASDGRTLLDPAHGSMITAAVRWSNTHLWQSLLVNGICGFGWNSFV